MLGQFADLKFFNNELHWFCQRSHKTRSLLVYQFHLLSKQTEVKDIFLRLIQAKVFKHKLNICFVLFEQR